MYHLVRLYLYTNSLTRYTVKTQCRAKLREMKHARQTVVRRHQMQEPTGRVPSQREKARAQATRSPMFLIYFSFYTIPGMSDSFKGGRSAKNENAIADYTRSSTIPATWYLTMLSVDLYYCVVYTPVLLLGMWKECGRNVEGMRSA